MTKFRFAQATLPPLVLLALSIVSSLVISTLSFYRTYWILERQWVAGMALTCLSSTWFFAELFRSSRAKDNFVASAPAVAYVALVGIGLTHTFADQLSRNVEERRLYQQFVQETRSESELRTIHINDDAGFLNTANVNIARREPVWTMFIDWYDNVSGMRPEFRDTNPSWSGFLGNSQARAEPTG